MGDMAALRPARFCQILPKELLHAVGDCVDPNSYVRGGSAVLPRKRAAPTSGLAGQRSSSGTCGCAEQAAFSRTVDAESRIGCGMVKKAVFSSGTSSQRSTAFSKISYRVTSNKKLLHWFWFRQFLLQLNCCSPNRVCLSISQCYRCCSRKRSWSELAVTGEYRWPLTFVVQASAVPVLCWGDTVVMQAEASQVQDTGEAQAAPSEA